MIVLGVETSGPTGSLALRRDGRCIEERFLSDLGRRHARTLIPEAKAFLARHNLELSDVEGIAISIGPGSFTGLRIGITFAKVLAYANSAPLVAVETFAAIAEACGGTSPVAVVADAQRRGVMLGRYDRQQTGLWERSGEIQLVPLEGVREALAGVTLVVGPGVVRLREPGSLDTQIAAERFAQPRAATIARLGEIRLLRNETSDARLLEPFYVRKSGAEENRRAPAGGE